MRKYRYRTPVLAGPWRESRDQALEDAARAGQIRLDGSGRRIRWMVPGKIEVDRSAACIQRGAGSVSPTLTLE